MIESLTPQKLSENIYLQKKVLLVDDHAVVRRGLASLINEAADLVVCGEADNERSAIEAVAKLQPDIAVVDWSLGHREAAELVEFLREGYPQMPVLVLSVHDEMFYSERALQAGASGYVMKQEATERIIDAIRRVIGGHFYLTERAVRALPDSLRTNLERNRHGLDGNHAGEPAGRSAKRVEVTDISIVIPVFNSEGTIEQLSESLIHELGHSYRLQLILVDDSSNDQSMSACQRLHQRHPDIVDCLQLSRNFGEHNAVMAGLNCADGDYCVIMDDDMQNPPSEVRCLIEEIKSGHDVVYVRYPRKHHTWFRNLGSWLHNWMATCALDKPPDLYLSSFKILSRFVVREIVRYTGPDPYLDAIILRTTRKIGVVSVRHAPREDGTSGYTIRKLISLWGNMMVSFSLWPVRLIGICGLAMMLTGIGYGMITFAAYLIPSMPDPDTYQQLNASNWFFRGVTLMFICLVAEYVGRIYMSVNRNPQFIIRNLLRHRPRS